MVEDPMDENNDDNLWSMVEKLEEEKQNKNGKDKGEDRILLSNTRRDLNKGKK